MEWGVFTYKENTELPFHEWLVRLAKGIRAEQVQLIGIKDQVLMSFPSNYNDEYDEFGQPI